MNDHQRALATQLGKRMIDKPVVIGLIRDGSIVQQRGLLWHCEQRSDEQGLYVAYITLQLDCAGGKATLRDYQAASVLWVREDR